MKYPVTYPCLLFSTCHQYDIPCICVNINAKVRDKLIGVFSCESHMFLLRHMSISYTIVYNIRGSGAHPITVSFRRIRTFLHHW